MDVTTENEIQAGRDLLTRHLLITSEAEEHGVPEIAARANHMWRLHESELDVLEDQLAQARQ